MSILIVNSTGNNEHVLKYIHTPTRTDRELN